MTPNEIRKTAEEGMRKIEDCILELLEKNPKEGERQED